MSDPWTFSLDPAGPASVAIRPCVEACLSVRVGEDPERLRAAWTGALEVVRYDARHVHHNGPDGGPVLASAAHAEEVSRALATACGAQDGGLPVRWGALGYIDVAGADSIPAKSATLAFGWVREPDAPRGLMIRVTSGMDADWARLASLAEALAAEPCAQWITVGYRFVTVPWCSPLLAEALQVVHDRSRRFHGVDVGDPLEVQASTWQHRLRGIGWITVVSDRLIAAAPAPAGPLPGGVSSRRLAAARWYQAGERPSVCDVNRRERPEAYASLDRWLSALRPARGAHFLPPWTEASSRRWIERFSPRDALAPEA
ncbi:type VI immunity family protein [Sorangium sp. So ce118]